MDQSEILERARSLGKQLAQSSRVKAYLDAEQGLQRNEAARKLLRDYQLLAEKLQHQQAQGQAVADPDAVRLGQLEQELAASGTVKAWLKAQSDYVDLMYRIDRSMQEGLAEAIGVPSAGTAQPSVSQPFVPRIVNPGPEA